MNKNCLILGASSDIGVHLIKNMNWQPEDVILAHYHSSLQKVEALKDEISCKIVPIQADFSLPSSETAFLDQIDPSVTLTHIVHLPSIPVENKRFTELAWVDYERYMHVQLRPIVAILQRHLPQMAKNRYGRIVFLLTSCTLNVPPKFLSAYVTAKYALMGLMKSVAVEYAKKGINVNAVSPSMIETAFLSKLDERIVAANAAKNPMGRNANVAEVTACIRYLLSEEAAYITGTNIPISGGEVF